MTLWNDDDRYKNNYWEKIPQQITIILLEIMLLMDDDFYFWLLGRS